MELSKVIQSDPSKGEFFLQDSLARIMRSAMDAHLAYLVPSCLRVDLLMPVGIIPVLVSNLLVIRSSRLVINGQDLTKKYLPAWKVGWDIETINGSPSVEFIQQYADATLVEGGDPSSRFNSAVVQQAFVMRTSRWHGLPETDMLTFALRNPDDRDQLVEISADWQVFAIPSTSAATLLKSCKSAGLAAASGNHLVDDPVSIRMQRLGLTFPWFGESPKDHYVFQSVGQMPTTTETQPVPSQYHDIPAFLDGIVLRTTKATFALMMQSAARPDSVCPASDPSGREQPEELLQDWQIGAGPSTTDPMRHTVVDRTADYAFAIYCQPSSQTVTLRLTSFMPYRIRSCFSSYCFVTQSNTFFALIQSNLATVFAGTVKECGAPILLSIDVTGNTGGYVILGQGLLMALFQPAFDNYTRVASVFDIRQTKLYVAALEFIADPLVPEDYTGLSDAYYRNGSALLK
jgi:hypothetical protein